VKKFASGVDIHQRREVDEKKKIAPRLAAFNQRPLTIVNPPTKPRREAMRLARRRMFCRPAKPLGDLKKYGRKTISPPTA